MWVVVLAESAIEKVPEEIVSHPVVRKAASRRRKSPHELILDSSIMMPAMKSLEDSRKRGRPDIVHVASLLCLESIPYAEGVIDYVIHTYDDQVITFTRGVRIPKNYLRFIGLFEQLFKVGRVPPSSEQPLIRVRALSFSELMSEIAPKYTVALSDAGEIVHLPSYVKSLSSIDNVCWVIGGFPHGELSHRVLDHVDDVISIYRAPLHVWTVISELLTVFRYCLVEGCFVSQA
ncbi:MAG: 16S rRNA methyltransferase [Thermoproteota archaeon]|nr:MAG: 16S rRNA methyltransferase [Candidatus Korarchaeota archaeon]RLG55564.1 MAG: 16S rRNA methyltransferase [Candidatus Korarchaeota archaeon]